MVRESNVVGFDFGAEAGGAVVGEGDAVDYELSLIFGAAGMENGVAFIEPAGLGVDEINHGAAGERCGAIGDGLLVEMIGDAGAVGVEERGSGGDVHSGADGGDAEFDDVLGGKRRADLDEAVEGSEAFQANLEAVAAEGEIADDGEAGIVGGKGAAELDSVAGEIDGGFDGLGVWAKDFEAKLSGVALAVDRKRQKRESAEENCEVGE